MNDEYEARKLIKESPELKEELQQEQDPDCKYNELFAYTQYKVKDCCLYRTKKAPSEKEQDEDIYLANFIIIPESETISDNGLDVERYFTLKAVRDYKELPTASILADKFSSMNFIIPTWGLSLRTSTVQNTISYIKDSIQAQGHNVKINHVYSHTGWRKVNDRWVFLHAGGAIGAEGLCVQLEGRLSRYALGEGNSGRIALDFLNVCSKEITIPLLAFTHLSVLNEFLRQSGIEPSFIIFLLGMTGLMKSTLAALTLSFFGKFDCKTLPASFKDTTNSLEKQGFLLKDVLTVVDDYHPSGSRSDLNKMESVAQAITRSYGDRAGRQRMNSDTTLKQSYIPRGNLIITGEDIPNIGQSGTARHLTLEIKKGDINIEALTDIQNKADMLSAHMRKFIEWLIPQTKELPKHFKEQFLQLRQEAMRTEQHGRLPEVVAHLQLGYLMMLNYLEDNGDITAAESEAMAAEAWNIFIKLAEAQAKRIQDDKPTIKFMNALKEMLSTHICYVVSVNSDSSAYGPGFIGYSDDIYYYLYPETVYQQVVKFYATQGDNFPIGKVTLLKHLDTEKLIHVEDDGKAITRTPAKRIKSGKLERFLWIPKNIMNVTPNS